MRLRSVLTAALVCLAFCAGEGRADLSAGLVAYYSFSNNANDASGNGNDGTVYGANWTAAGAIGSGLIFDGSEDYVLIPNAPSQQMTTNQLTLSAWIRLDEDVERQARIICKQQDNPIAWGLEVFGAGYSGATGNQLCFHDSDGSTYRNHLSPTYLNPGQLYHVAVTDDAGLVTLYIDGQEDLLSVGGFGIPSLIAAPIKIGATNDPSTFPSEYFFFDGLIDEVRVYDRVLSATEIEELAVISVPLPGAALLGMLGLVYSSRRLRRA